MEAQGVDGVLRLSESHLTIFWTSLRGRLSNSNGADIEAIPLERIFDHSLVQATHTQLGSLQIRLFNTDGSLVPLNRESQLEESLLDKVILHSVTFHEINLPQFMNLHRELQIRVTKAKAKILDQIIGLDEGAASS